MVAQYCNGLCAIVNGRQQTQEEGSQDQAEVDDIVDETVIIGGCGTKANTKQVRLSWPNSLIVMLFHILPILSDQAATLQPSVRKLDFDGVPHHENM